MIRHTAKFDRAEHIRAKHEAWKIQKYLFLLSCPWKQRLNLLPEKITAGMTERLNKLFNIISYNLDITAVKKHKIRIRLFQKLQKIRAGFFTCFFYLYLHSGYAGRLADNLDRKSVV